MDLYNDSHEKVCILSGIKETCIISTLKTGDKEITFEFRKTNRYAADIKEEGYINFNPRSREGSDSKNHQDYSR